MQLEALFKGCSIQPIVREGGSGSITMPMYFIVATQGQTPPADLIIGHVTI